MIEWIEIQDKATQMNSTTDHCWKEITNCDLQIFMNTRSHANVVLSTRRLFHARSDKYQGVASRTNLALEYPSRYSHFLPYFFYHLGIVKQCFLLLILPLMDNSLSSASFWIAINCKLIINIPVARSSHNFLTSSPKYCSLSTMQFI